MFRFDKSFQTQLTAAFLLNQQELSNLRDRLHETRHQLEDCYPTPLFYMLKLQIEEYLTIKTNRPFAIVRLLGEYVLRRRDALVL